ITIERESEDFRATTFQRQRPSKIKFQDGFDVLGKILKVHSNSSVMYFLCNHKRAQKMSDLSPEEKLRESCDIKATNIILLGLPVDIYTNQPLPNCKRNMGSGQGIDGRHGADTSRTQNRVGLSQPLSKKRIFTKFAERIRDLLVYVSVSCPFTQSEKEKWAPATSHRKSNKPYVDALTLNKTVVNDTQKHALGRNTKNDRIQRPSSRSKKNKVEVQLRKFKSNSNKNNFVSDCNANVKNVVVSNNYANVCLSCNECLFSANHDACIVKYLKNVQKCKKAKFVKQKEKIQWKPTGRVFTNVGLRWKPTGKMFNMEGSICPIIKTTPATIVPSRNRLHTISIPAVAPNADTRMRSSIAKNSLIRAYINMYSHPFNNPNYAFIVKIILWYLDSGCSKHMTGQREKLINFVSKFIGLGHNLFSVGQFCDLDLEVDVLHSTINQLAKEGLVKGLPKLKYTKDHLCSACQMGKSKKECHKPKPAPSTNEKLQMLHMDLCGLMRVESINGKRYILVIVDGHSRFTWVKFFRTKDEAPDIIIKFLKQAQESSSNIEAARTILIFSKSLIFLWAEAVAIACYTQNISFIHTRYNKTPYELLRDRKPDLKYLHIFGALCYPTNDSEDLGKLKPKVDIGIFIGYSPSKKAYRIYNKHTRLIMEIIHVQFDELTQMASEQHGLGPELQGLTSRHISSGLVPNHDASTSAKPPTKNDWDLLFQPIFDEYFKPQVFTSPNNETIASPILSTNVEE
ncbi:retrovirus-related pol polyprotein from transposon TNT 1-94, partial [Tanacetum coccineum]